MLHFSEQQRNFVLREIEQTKDAVIDFGFRVSDLASEAFDVELKLGDGFSLTPSPSPNGRGEQDFLALLPSPLRGEGLGMRERISIDHPRSNKPLSTGSRAGQASS